MRYFALGGEARAIEVDAYLNGAISLAAFQHDILAHAINERLDEIAPPHAPYSGDFVPTGYIVNHSKDQGDTPSRNHLEVAHVRICRVGQRHTRVHSRT